MRRQITFSIDLDSVKQNFLKDYEGQVGCDILPCNKIVTCNTQLGFQYNQIVLLHSSVWVRRLMTNINQYL